MAFDWRDYQRLRTNADKVIYDSSETSYQCYNNTYNNNKKFMTTNDVEQLILQRQQMTELVITTKTIMKIDMQYFPNFIYFQDSGKLEHKIDMSVFDNLTMTC